MGDLGRILLLVSAFAFITTKAQDKTIDSLLKRLEKLPEDTEKVITLDALCDHYETLDDNRSAVEYGKQAAGLADTLHWNPGRSRAYNNLGVAYFNLGNFPEALHAYLASLKARIEMHDKKGVAASHNNIGIIYSILGNQQESLKSQFMALRLKREAGDSAGLHHSFTNIGVCYEKMGDTMNARKYYLLALKKQEEAKDEHQAASSMMNLGGTYSGTQPREALKYYERGLALMQKHGDKFGEAVCHFDMAFCYEKLGKLSDALKLTQKALEFAGEAGFLDLAREAENRLSDTYGKMGDFARALEHYKKFVGLRDSLFNEENTKKMVRSEMNFEFEKKEAATKAEQEKKDVLAAAAKRRQLIVLLAISGFGLLILGFAIFAYRSFLQKKKATIEISRQKELIEEKQKEILDSIYYARRIQRSLLPTEKYITKVLDR